MLLNLISGCICKIDAISLLLNLIVLVQCYNAKL